LAPASCERHLDAVVAIDLGCEIDHDQTTLVHLASLAQPSEDAALGIVHHQPFEAGSLAIEGMKGRQLSIKAVEIANQARNSRMPWPFKQMPVERVVVAPFLLLRQLASHEEELLTGMSEHEAIVDAQIGKSLPLVARHASENRALAVHDLVMGQRQDEIFRE